MIHEKHLKQNEKSMDKSFFFPYRFPLIIRLWILIITCILKFMLRFFSKFKLKMKETAFSNDGNFRPVMFKAIYTCIHLNVDMKQLIN